MQPVLQPDVNIWIALAYAALNPATIYVAAELGRRADAPSKLLLAAFSGAIAGVALLWVLAYLRIPFASSVGRAASGIMAASFIAGLVWAGASYRLFRRPR